MKIIQKLKSWFAKPAAVENKTANPTAYKTSLAYLAYKNRKLKSGNYELPTVFFGDEWAL